MFKDYSKFVKIATKQIGARPNDFLHLKKIISKKTALPLPSNADLKKVYNRLISSGQITPNSKLEKALQGKKIRTLSGVAVVAVLTKSYPCPGKCLYCPDEKNMPKSYLSNEPAVMRAITSDFDPYRQVQARIKSLELNGHCAEKIELIVMGGTFSSLPSQYQKKFIRECFRAANDYPLSLSPDKNTSLKKEQKKNENSRYRIVGLTLETRPDYINFQEALSFRKLGCTRVELGVQHIDDKILDLNHRGHSSRETIYATKILKNFGFKINYHMMPGMWGSSPQKDLSMFENIFSLQEFQPDMLKIYPCVVTQNAPLFSLWKKKKFIPLEDIAAKNLLKKIKKIIPPYVRISRIIRDIPQDSIVAGPKLSNLRQIIAEEKTSCQCIRCRETRQRYKKNEPAILDRIDYPASGGREIFLQYVSPDKQKLFALLRLRINDPADAYFQKNLPSAIQKAAIIRELHTYGKLVAIKKKGTLSPQHSGFGEKLLKKAEQISFSEFNLKKIAVISGIGVRKYYQKRGYFLQDDYMLKLRED